MGGIFYMKGYKTKELWNDPNYRKRMSEAHRGQIPTNLKELQKLLIGNKYCIGRIPWNKGKTCPQLQGKNNGHWKGGTQSERKLAMRKNDYRLWRTAVFMRDNYTCQECGMRGKYMEADHIKSWEKYPELRYAIDNGRTLCRSCHQKTENYPKNLLGGVN